MSKGLGKGVGVPVKLLHESEGHIVTVRVMTMVICATRKRPGMDAKRAWRRASMMLGLNQLSESDTALERERARLLTDCR